MILRQYLHSDPVGASYLFGCAGRAAAAVVDPVGDISPYLRTANETGMRMRYVIDTHLHADHISSARQLSDATGAGYVLFKDAKVSFPFRGAKDGDVLDLGNVTIKVLHTPGHTPEHISMLITDRTRSDEPWFVLTGHTLMVGDLGRTELATDAEEGARVLFGSISPTNVLAEGITEMRFVGMTANGVATTTDVTKIHLVSCTVKYALSRPTGTTTETVSCIAWLRSW